MASSRGDSGARGNPTDLHASANEVRAVEAAVRVLETHREAMSNTAERMRVDVQDMRDRMIRLETKVDGLPTKEWFGGQVYKAVGLTAVVVGMIATILHLLGKG